MNFISVRFLSNPKFCYFFLLLSSFLGLLNSVLLIKEGSLHNYYLERQAGYTLTCIILLIVFHKKIILVLNKVHIWAIKPFDLYPKKCVLLAFLIVVGTFQSKVFLGFWFAGIAGWDYSNYKLKQRPAPDNFQKLSVPKFLQEAVIEQNANSFITQDTYLDQRYFSITLTVKYFPLTARYWESYSPTNC